MRTEALKAPSRDELETNFTKLVRAIKTGARGDVLRGMGGDCARIILDTAAGLITEEAGRREFLKANGEKE